MKPPVKTQTLMGLGALLTTALLAFGTQAAAHTVAPLGPEAENRDRDAGFCAPDGESVRTINGNALELPHSGCWAEYDVIIGGGAPLSLFLHPPGNECGKIDIKATQSANHVPLLVWSGSTPVRCNGAGYVCVQSNLFLAPGEYTIRITSVITSGPAWGNQYIDYLSVGAAGVCL